MIFFEEYMTAQMPRRRRKARMCDICRTKRKRHCRPKAPGEHLPEREKNDGRHTAQAAQDGADAPQVGNGAARRWQTYAGTDTPPQAGNEAA